MTDIRPEIHPEARPEVAGEALLTAGPAPLPAPLDGDNVETELVAGAEPVPRTQWQLFRRRFFRHKLAIVSLVVLALLFVLCYGANLLREWTPLPIQPQNQQDLLLGPTSPSADHWFGTDELGRDYFSEVLYAGQTSLQIGIIVGLLSTLLGTLVGAVAGYFGRWSDQVLMRTTDIFLVLPQLVVLAIALKYFGGTKWVVALVLAGLFWMGVARIVRAQVLAVKEKEFVEAARAAGASPRRIIVRHILPNCIGPILVAATLAVAAAILTESALSYLGFGVELPETSWGNMLSTARGYVGTGRSYLIYFPGLMILLTVLAVNFLGDGMRDAFDPQAKH